MMKNVFNIVLFISLICVSFYAVRMSSYTTAEVVRVDNVADEITIEYNGHLYDVLVQDADEFSVGEMREVLMKSSLCWDFELNPLDDICEDIR